MNKYDLEILEQFADELTNKANPNAIDNVTYTRFTTGIKDQAADTSLFGFKTKRNIKKAAKISPEYGDNTNWKDILNFN